MNKIKCEEQTDKGQCGNKATIKNFGYDLCRKHNEMLLEYLEEQRQLRKVKNI